MPEYLNDRGLQRQHHQSYNDFINNGIQKTVEANKMVRCNNNARWYIEYTGIRIGGWDLYFLLIFLSFYFRWYLHYTNIRVGGWDLFYYLNNI